MPAPTIAPTPMKTACYASSPAGGCGRAAPSGMLELLALAARQALNEESCAPIIRSISSDGRLCWRMDVRLRCLQRPSRKNSAPGSFLRSRAAGMERRCLTSTARHRT